MTLRLLRSLRVRVHTINETLTRTPMPGTAGRSINVDHGLGLGNAETLRSRSQLVHGINTAPVLSRNTARMRLPGTSTPVRLRGRLDLVAYWAGLVETSKHSTPTLTQLPRRPTFLSGDRAVRGRGHRALVGSNSRPRLKGIAKWRRGLLGDAFPRPQMQGSSAESCQLPKSLE
jgi:hypothetical protein